MSESNTKKRPVFLRAKWNHLLFANYEVEHPQWTVSKVDDYSITFDFEKVYGDRYSFLSDQKPQSVFYCEGSNIIVRMGKTLNL